MKYKGAYKGVFIQNTATNANTAIAAFLCDFSLETSYEPAVIRAVTVLQSRIFDAYRVSPGSSYTKTIKLIVSQETVRTTIT